MDSKIQDKVLADEVFGDGPPRAKCRKCGELVFVGVRCPNCGKVLGQKITNGEVEFHCPRCGCSIQFIVRPRHFKNVERNQRSIEKEQTIAK